MADRRTSGGRAASSSAGDEDAEALARRGTERAGCDERPTEPRQIRGPRGRHACCDRCAELEKQYEQKLAEAKACSPELAVEQCTKLVGAALACACPTFVNPSQRATAELENLVAKWNAQGCGATVECGDILCTEPSGSTCTPSSPPYPGTCTVKP